MKHSVEHIRDIGKRFRINGDFIDAAPYGTGHINDTYASRWKVDGSDTTFIQQRINHKIFTDPPNLMDNIYRVTTHLRSKLSGIPEADPSRETLNVVPTTDGNSFFRDSEGNYWRTYVFVKNALTYDVCTGPEMAYESARMFGRFQMLLTDFPGDTLHETIPGFHHTPRRFKALKEAVSCDAAGRNEKAAREIDFAMRHEDITQVVTGLLESKEMPLRVTHNDTKLNNVMIDNTSNKGVCVIDLDTVMPGSVLYDFGDMVRTATRTCDEDERDLDKVFMKSDMFEALAKGYLESSSSFLTPIEFEYLAFSGILITFTIGIRFLTDYLSGDVYFKTHRPDQNLDRCRVQFKMVESMEAQKSSMETIIAKSNR